VPERFLPAVLVAFGLGFFLANLRLAAEQIAYLRRRSQARLVWPSRRPPYYGLYAWVGVTLALVIVAKVLVIRWPTVIVHIVGETMMFLYYACLLPLSLRIRRGFYERGIWFDGGFLPYAAIGSVSWRDEDELALMVVPRRTRRARRLAVPPTSFGEARKLLRELIANGTIRFSETELRLGVADDRDRV
jgi:hypothetical protein